MSTSVPNFNFLALLVSEICRGPTIKIGGADVPRRPIPDKFLHANVYKCAKF